MMANPKSLYTNNTPLCAPPTPQPTVGDGASPLAYAQY